MSRLGEFWKRLSTGTQAVIVILVVLGLAAASGNEEDGVVAPPATPEAVASPPTTGELSTTSIAATTTTASLTTPPSTTSPSTPTTAPTSTPLPAAVALVSVTDGDTIRVKLGGLDEPLRLIGINAPEDNECYADEATSALRTLVEDESLRLETDRSDRDQFGRLLRYVYVGEVFVNEWMVEQGYAIAREYPPDTRHADRLSAAQSRARDSGRGLWAPDACGSVAAGAITIGTIRYDADGNDNFNLNDEWVELTNPGESVLDLTGWGVKDESASHRYRFPGGFTLEGGATVRLHTGCGTDTAVALYWCNQGSAIWNNSGDTVFVLDPSGNVTVSESYPG